MCAIWKRVRDGGNIGIDDFFSRKARKGKFRVIGVDTTEAIDWLEGDFDTLKAAKKRIAEIKKRKMPAGFTDPRLLDMYVFNDRGVRCYRAF